MQHRTKQNTKKSKNDDFLSRNISCKRNGLSNNKAKEKEKSEQSLSMKLRAAECELQKIKAKLLKADNQIMIKNRENEELKRQAVNKQKLQTKKSTQGHSHEIENSKYLHRKCVKLEQQVKEIEEFFLDYDMIWVGEKKHNYNYNSENQTKDNYIDDCYDQLMQNIAQLNIATKKDEMIIEYNDEGASFKSSARLLLKIYKNGLVVENGLLRPYSESSTKSFIRDILDGYFPSELQKDYPNGVLLKVEDHRLETFMGKGFGFTGNGYKLGKKAANSKSKRKLDSNPNTSKCSLNNLSYNSNTKAASMSGSNGSSRLSRTSSVGSNLRSQISASHNSHCLNAHIQSHINAEIKAKFKADFQQHTSTVASEASQSMTTLPQPGKSRFLHPRRYNSLDRSSFSICTNKSNSFRVRSRSVNSLGHGYSSISSSGSRVTSSTSNTSSTRSEYERNYNDKRRMPFSIYMNESSGKDGEFRLKIRSLNGCLLYLVYATTEDTVEKLYKLINKVMPKNQQKKYKIVMSGLGMKRLEQMNFTLENCGIFTDSVLHLIDT